MKNIKIYLLLTIFLLLMQNLFSYEFEVYDLKKDFDEELTHVIIKNDSLFSKNHYNNYLYSFDFKENVLEKYHYPDDLKVTSLYYFKSGNIIASTDDDFYKYDGKQWSIFDTSFGGYNIGNLPPVASFNNNEEKQEIFCTLGYVGVYLIKDQKINMIEFEDQSQKIRYLPRMDFQNSLILNNNYYYFNVQDELIEIENENFITYDKNDYFQIKNSVYSNVAVYHISQHHFKNKLWFSTGEGSIVSFDGENFEKHFYLQEGPCKEDTVLVSDFLFDNNNDLWTKATFITKTDKGLKQYMHKLFKFHYNSNFTTWDEIEIPNLDSNLSFNLYKDSYDIDNKYIYIKYWNRLFVYKPNVSKVVEVENSSSLILRKIYPTPTKDLLKIEFTAARNTYSNIEIDLYDLYGNKVLSEKPNIIDYDSNEGLGNLSLDISRINNGILILVIKDGKTKRYSKIIKIDR